MSISMSRTGYLKVDLDVTVKGPLSKKEGEKLKKEIINFFEERKINISGKISHVEINTIEVEKSNTNLDYDTTV